MTFGESRPEYGGHRDRLRLQRGGDKRPYGLEQFVLTLEVIVILSHLVLFLCLYTG